MCVCVCTRQLQQEAARKTKSNQQGRGGGKADQPLGGKADQPLGGKADQPLGGKGDQPAGKKRGKVFYPGRRADPPLEKTGPPSNGSRGGGSVPRTPKVVHAQSKSSHRRITQPLSKTARSVRFVGDSDPSEEEVDSKEGWDSTQEGKESSSSATSELTARAKAELGCDSCEIVDVVDKSHDVCNSDLESAGSDRSFQMEEVEVVDSENELSIQAEEIVDRVMGGDQRKGTAAVTQGTMGSVPHATTL